MDHLQVKELRRRGGLAMRREPHSIRIDELPHPFEVVLKLLAVENSYRQAQVFVQKIPAELRKLVRIHFKVNRPQSLVLRGDEGEPFPRGCQSVVARHESPQCRWYSMGLFRTDFILRSPAVRANSSGT